MSKAITESQIELLLQPETDLEHRIIAEPGFQKGLYWGKPRFGHPEGQIINHIPEVLTNIEKLDVSADIREKLRLLAYVHDTFKYLEDKSEPRDWSKHHGIFARKFLAQFIDDPILLDIVELHDEAYYAWRLAALYKAPEKGAEKLDRLIDRIQKELQLYYLFFKCDTQTGDKIQAPVKWFEDRVEGIKVVFF